MSQIKMIKIHAWVTASFAFPYRPVINLSIIHVSQDITMNGNAVSGISFLMHLSQKYMHQHFNDWVRLCPKLANDLNETEVFVKAKKPFKALKKIFHIKRRPGSNLSQVFEQIAHLKRILRDACTCEILTNGLYPSFEQFLAVAFNNNLWGRPRDDTERQHVHGSKNKMTL